MRKFIVTLNLLDGGEWVITVNARTKEEASFITERYINDHAKDNPKAPKGKEIDLGLCDEIPVIIQREKSIWTRIFGRNKTKPDCEIPLEYTTQILVANGQL